MSRFLPALALPLLILCCASCRSIPPLPPADFSAPGWHVQQGQGIWKPTKTRPELAGEILLATNANGNFFIQFTKTPFPLAVAQVRGSDWQIEFGAGEHSWRGRGEPPAHFVWFQLPTALAGKPVSGAWKFERREGNSWRLANPRTGQTLEGVFFP